MFFTEAKTIGVRMEFRQLEELMIGLEFDRWSWDYTKAVYDLKYQTDDAEYYLRVPAYVVGEKQLEHPKAVLELGVPIFTQHFYPHGLDDEVEVPESLKETVEKKLKEVEEALSAKSEA